MRLQVGWKSALPQPTNLLELPPGQQQPGQALHTSLGAVQLLHPRGGGGARQGAVPRGQVVQLAAGVCCAAMLRLDEGRGAGTTPAISSQDQGPSRQSSHRSGRGGRGVEGIIGQPATAPQHSTATPPNNTP